MADTSIVYKTWDDGFIVRRMNAEDAKILRRWYGKICPTAFDIDIALESFPPEERGFYIGEFEGEVVASAIRIPWSQVPKVYYGSYYYVVEKFRRMGFGRRLRDEVAAEHVGKDILCIDGHDDLEAMNKRKGYTSGFKVVMYKGKPKIGATRSSGVNIVKASKVDFDMLMKYDSKYFIQPDSVYRSNFMKKWIAMEGGASFVAMSNNNEIVGLGCRRPAFQSEGNHLIGPLYAEDSSVAHDLMKSLAEDLDKVKDIISINICEPNKQAEKLMHDLDLCDDLHMLRMHLNGDPKEYKPQVFALTSIDVCGF